MRLKSLDIRTNHSFNCVVRYSRVCCTATGRERDGMHCSNIGDLNTVYNNLQNKKYRYIISLFVSSDRYIS